ncbi:MULTISPECIES: serine/threonine-protein kinase [Streptomyces]|uniref:non-specific serine/threonine protein kinase n=3 Tax=Streptomyces venezuelae TaxID=54571 RepID=F2RD36_STRVP|nr:serine/threonine-protein kinase [Streptomyces venezuelae]APE22707.1 serine/threonine protein kinase [Streptomyces venezuelae]QES00084.1 serine/threonine protein kinase [Streptomyces venezuelae ATCC 10712]CCA56932.1 putative serine or threonine protein kinase [Streptomyces venezuelae ATCC 10712]
MGEVFAGRYELVDPIGRGGAGAVWRAWDHRRRRYVAAKVLLQSDAHTLLRFVREQALRIDHPHVLAPASWAADDDKVLFTMDLVAGGSLAHVIGDYGPLPPRFVCVLLDQLLSGLATVHAEGVVHRDIKPANILLDVTGTGRPHLRLSDFGISMRKGEPRLTETDYVVGTPGYFAPEQLLGAEPDFTADLFGVGLVGLYLLQGRKPDSRALVEHFVTHGTPAAPEGIPEPLWQVLAGLLQPDPQARFRTATGARKALSAAVEMLPEPRADEAPVEIRDQLGPLPSGFGPEGPTGPTDTAAPTTPAETPAGATPAAPGPTPAPGPAPAPAPTPTAPGLAPAPVSLPVPPQQQPPQPHYQPQHPLSPGAAPYAAPYAAHQAAPAPTVAPMPSPSETGSFHLPPPVAHPIPSFEQAPTSAVPYEQAPTHPYTARPVQVPEQQHAPSAPGAAPVRRPGPPPKVTVPVLLLALICFAVGFWALAQT